MGVICICAYRPLPGKDRELMDEMRKHLPTLRSQGLVTDRPSTMMRAKDGTILEVFEWKSKEAVDAAHENPAVLAMWDRYSRCCTYESLDKLEECHVLFAPFAPVG